MKPALRNYLNFTLAMNQRVAELFKNGYAIDAYILSAQSHPESAYGEGLDVIGPVVGIPARNGVAVPDAVMREAILKELDK